MPAVATQRLRVAQQGRGGYGNFGGGLNLPFKIKPRPFKPGKIKPGLILKPQLGGAGRGCSPSARRAGLCGWRPGGTASGQRPTKPPRPAVLCLGGRAAGEACLCHGGAKPVRIGRRGYRCVGTPPTARPCPAGQVRIGRRCRPIVGPPDPPASPCIGGYRRGATCICPAGTLPARAGRRATRCVAQPCPAGAKRIGRRCVSIDPPRPPPPPCIGGRVKGDACVCPPGERLIGRRCIPYPGGGSGGTGGGGGSGGSGTGGGSGGTSSPPSCLGGRQSAQGCVCPDGARPVPISRRITRCVFDPCPKGKRRIGRLCVAIDLPPPRLPPADDPPQPLPPPLPPPPTATPNPDCPAGWRLAASGACRRADQPACPAGTLTRGGRCLAVAPPLPPSASPPARPTPLPSRAPAGATAADDDFVADEVLVEISATPPEPVAQRLANTYALQQLSSRRIATLGSSLYRFRIPRGRTVETIVAALAGEAGVDAAQPNFVFRLNAGAAVGAAAPMRIPQYAGALIKLGEAHRVTRGRNVLVAVVDSAADAGHPEFAPAVAERFDAFGEADAAPDDHGTAIAGIIAARASLEGVAPDARLLLARAFEPRSSGAAGRGTSERVIASVDWAIQRRARVVNMSFEGPADAMLGRLFEQGEANGTIFVAAAGNSGPRARPAFPAAHPDVIAVTAVDEARDIYPQANAGAYVDIAAPGVGVLVAVPGGAYDMMSGTSFAAAHVSGVAALMLATAPRMSKTRLLQQLAATSVDLGAPGRDEVFGAGVIDALRALVDRAAAVGGR